ncbi:MAG: phosphatase PAP2 family protein [Thermoanaerobaculia bacterium]
MTPAVLLRRIRPRTYEVLVLLHVAAVLVLVRAVGRLPSLPWDTLLGVRLFALPLALFLLGAVAVRALAVASREGTGRARRLLAVTFRPSSAFDLLRLLLVAGLLYHGHVWLKVIVPFLNPQLFDADLARLDAAIHFGLNPGPFALGLLPWPFFLRSIDVYYAAFVPLTVAGMAWFLTAPSRPERARFAAGFALLWLAGAWLYVALPALGPCYVYAPDYAESARSFPLQTATQTLLLTHYRALLGAAAKGESIRILPVLGIGAMPSLHVAAHAFLALFARRRSRLLFLFFTAATVLTFWGSLVTGWHYAVDGYAGLLLALLCWRLGEKLASG